MDDLPEQLEIPLKLRVPRSAFVIIAPEPATVTQKNVEQHFGIPATTYKRMARDGLFPTKRVGRLIFAAYEDVKAAVTEGAVARTRLRKAVEAATESPAEYAPMSVEAAQSYLASARTPRERRERKREIEGKGWDLVRNHEPKLDDGSPNPRHDKALYEHGFDLVISANGLRRSGPNPASSDPGSKPGQGYYRKCCWCDRPAYATKQTWSAENWYWSGGAVCETCARRRAPNERVVRFETQEILLPALDPTVPKGWDKPRRPRRR